jgi:hypothetical protein
MDISVEKRVPTKIRYQIPALSGIPSQARLAARLAGFEKDGDANPARGSSHGIFFQEYIARSIHRGPFDGCWLFEERRWLGRSPFARVVVFGPVLGKDERPPVFPRRLPHHTFVLRGDPSVVMRLAPKHEYPAVNDWLLHLSFLRHGFMMTRRFDKNKGRIEA